MSSIAKIYGKELNHHFKTLYANWEPGRPIALGEYGLLDGDLFQPLGHLSDDFLEFGNNFIRIITDLTHDHKEFRSKDGLEVDLLAKGSVGAGGVALGKAAININFKRENAIFFNASECTTERIANTAMVGNVLKEMYKQDRWDSKYCVVTEVVTAGQAIIAISNSSTASIGFEAEDASVDKIALTDASVGLRTTAAKDIGYQVEAQKGLVLLLGLCQLRTGPFGGGMKPKSLGKKGSYEADGDEPMSFEKLGEE